MKKLFFALTVAGMFCVTNNAQAQEEKAPEAAPVWLEMEAFHNEMSETWHPLEEGNYAPIRERSAEMAEAAAAWKKSKIPSEYAAQKDIKKNLKELAEETAELDKEIKGGCSDEEIKEDLQELHDLFHTIVGLCKE